MAARRRQSLLNGALILSFAIIAVKLIGVLFKLYVTLKIGFEAKSFYATAYNIYTPVYSIALAGLPTAVSKMVASKAGQGKYKDVRRIFSTSLWLFAFTGVLGTAVILLLSYPWSLSIDAPSAMPSIIAIAPSLFFCCVMSGYRGYYQGLRDMVPSSVSQVFEAAGKLIFGWVLVNLVLGAGVTFADKIPFLNGIVDKPQQSYAAAAAISGVTIGSLMGLIYLIIRHRAGGDGITKEMLTLSPDAESSKSLLRELVMLAIPIALSSLVFNITTLIDNWTIQNRLAYVLSTNYDTVAKMYPGIVSARGFLDPATSAAAFKDYLYGAYDTVLEIKNIVPTFTVTLGLSAIPVLSEAWVKKQSRLIKSSIESVVRLTMLLALPAGAGLFALADDILYLLYGQSEVNAPAIPYIAPILMMYGISVCFLALAQPVTNMLQAIDRLKVPIRAMAIGAVTKLVANFVLVSIPSINIQGAVIGSILCNIIMVVYGMVVLSRETGLKYNYKTDFIKPLICAVLSGVAAWVTNALYERFLPAKGLGGILSGQNIATIAGVFAAVMVYAISLFAVRAVTKEDICMLPKGRKIAKVLEKFGLVG